MTLSPFEIHAPYQRIMTNALVPVDRQWLRLLADLLEPVSLDQLVNAGMTQSRARALLSLSAMVSRYRDASGAA